MSPAPPRRRLTTRAFLFSDLRGYTDFVERRGDAAAARLLRDYRTLVRREVARHDGAEVKTEGDSFYVVFRSPSAALDCAVEILRRADARNAKEPEFALRIGVGLHAGETIPHDDQFVGGAVNVASRLASKAGPGDLLISDTLRGLVRTGNSYAMADVGLLRLKGVGERVRAWRVTWRRDQVTPREDAEAGERISVLPPQPPMVGPAAASPTQLLCPVVIGRDAELRRLTELVDLAARGKGQTLLLAGEAGVGKSAFVREVEARAIARGIRVLYGAALESDRGLPYGPFIAAVRSGFRGLDRAQLGRLLHDVAPDLSQLFPELGSTRSAAAPTMERHHRLAVAFQGLLSAFARQTPLLVVVEDLHWSDESSLALLDYLARELRNERVLLLGTYRNDELHRRHPLVRVLASLQRERLVEELGLGRLSPDEIGALIDTTFARFGPQGRIASDLRSALFTRCEGNPFFAEELLKALKESGAISYTEGAGWQSRPVADIRIPASIRDAVNARVEHLAQDAQQTLSAAAAIGTRFSFDVLASVRGIAAADLLGHVRQLIEQQLVSEIGGEEDDYGFRHALTREVVYDGLLKPERRLLHQSIAAVLATRSSAEPSVLAEHFIAGGDAKAAVPHLLDAARRAAGADAPRESALHYERALEIGVADTDLAAAYEGLAQAYLLFDWDHARKAAEHALQLYRAGNARGASRMLVLISRHLELSGDFDRAKEVAREAIALVDGMDETVELGRALANLAPMGIRGSLEPDHDCVAMMERALAIGERLGDRWTQVEALLSQAWAFEGTAPGEALRLAERALELAMGEALPDAVYRSYLVRVAAMRSAGRDFGELLTTIEEGMTYARRHRIEQTGLAAARAWLNYGRGDWDAALADISELDAGRHPAAAWLRALITLGRDGPGAARPLFVARAEAEADFGALGTFAQAAGWAAYGCAVAGDQEAAVGWLSRLRARLDGDPANTPPLFNWSWNPLLFTAVLTGQRDWAEALLAL